MVYWLEGVLLYIASFLVHSNGIDPTCECVVFMSEGQSQGRFHSPNFPTPYKPGINCILFSFYGDVNEIVRITFMEFDLKAPLVISEDLTICRDWIRIYQNLDVPEVNEDSVYDVEFCGNISNLKEKTFYSSGRGLILEFHTDSESRESHMGFKGVFEFLLKSTFETDGDLQYGTQCTWYMQSYNNRTKGKFYSPRYPQKYPKSSNCQYRFFGHKNERVRVKFINIQLPNTGKSCEDSEDRITVYDGQDATKKVKATFCDVHNQVPLESKGPYMYIEFTSDRRHEKKGFAGEYEFIDENVTPVPTRDHPNNGQAESGDGTDTCNEQHFSTNAKEGIIASPKFPDAYPSSITCQYQFQGEGQERVQLQFLDLNLAYTGTDADDPLNCAEQDSVTVMVYHRGQEQALGVWCGKKKPKQMMSSTNKLKVIFRSDTKNTRRHFTGFQIKYSFVTDFGVKGNGVQDPRKVCTFVYESSEFLQGTFTSPNILGLYPRDTICKYIFYGKINERVVIKFTKFHVDGILPRCDGSTDSDLVSFSNYLVAIDRNMDKFCGKKHASQAKVMSDGPFFRVMFKSNNIYDATGFVGEYKFISEDTSTPSPERIGRSNVGTRSFSEASVAIATVLLLFQTVILQVL